MLASGDLTDGKDEDGVDSFQVGQINSELSIQNRQNIFFYKGSGLGFDSKRFDQWRWNEVEIFPIFLHCIYFFAVYFNLDVPIDLLNLYKLQDKS